MYDKENSIKEKHYPEKQMPIDTSSDKPPASIEVSYNTLMSFKKKIDKNCTVIIPKGKFILLPQEKRQGPPFKVSSEGLSQ